jgi:ferredoxin-NADP reductase
MVVALRSRKLLAPGIADLDFVLREPARLEFKAGQFVSFAVADASGAALPRRSYSIASPSDEPDHLRFIIRVIEGGAASDRLMGLAPGDELALTGPYGFFVLDDAHAGDVVFGATGTGLAAIMPMLGELAKRREPGRRLVYWGARHEDDLFARAEVEALAARAGAELLPHLTAPGPGWSGARGRITPAILDALPGLRSPTFYLVGNGAMITELKKELVARGVNRKAQVRTEAFFD